MKRFELTGKVFGHLTVIGLHDIMPQGARWDCQCICGKFRVVRGSRLARGTTHSCGCCSKIKHGQSSAATKEYVAWKAMKQRCYDKNSKSYDDYGGRGIRVCKQWKESFSRFFKDVGLAPSDKHTLDRYPDNNGNYRPGNVRWATAEQQANNRRKRRYYRKSDPDEEEE